MTDGQSDACACIAATPPVDMIEQPPHYTHGKYEMSDVVEDWFPGWHLGNVIKYIRRCNYKGNKLEDLKKARAYLNREINRLESLDDDPPLDAGLLSRPPLPIARREDTDAQA